MKWKVLKTETQYQKAVKRAMHIFHAGDGTADGDELALLLLLIKDYEDRHVIIPELDPIEVIKLKMAESGMKAKDLEYSSTTKSRLYDRYCFRNCLIKIVKTKY